jgi:flagellar motility protein MotE (MotC chaperone)
MERLLFYTLPVLFTLLLTGVLLTVFGYDVVNELLRIGNKVPGVSAMLPEPKPTEEELRAAMLEAEKQEAEGPTEEEEAKQIEAALSEKEAELEALRTDSDTKEQQIAELQAELEAAQEQEARQSASEAEYAANIKKLADVYAEMKPSKAAPVLENLTLSERVLVLKEMKEEQQVDILEKMDPTIAAETSILMKDVVAVRDLQIAALQERLALSGSETAASAALTNDELSRTFAQMTPDRAAEVLLEMEQSQVVNILRGMEEASRATILNSLAELDKDRTAQITARLG